MPSSPTIFDRQLLRTPPCARRRRLAPATFLIDRVAQELGERLSVVLRQFERAADLGTPTDAVAARWRRAAKSAHGRSPPA